MYHVDTVQTLCYALIMISSASHSIPASSLTAPTSSFSDFGLSIFDDGQLSEGGVGLGVSTAAVPLISAPISRQSPDFKAAIAPPSRPTNPAIAPPTIGGYTNTLGGTGGMINGATAKLAYISDFRTSHTDSQGNNPVGGRNEFLSMLSQTSTLRAFATLG